MKNKQDSTVLSSTRVIIRRLSTAAVMCMGIVGFCTSGWAIVIEGMNYERMGNSETGLVAPFTTADAVMTSNTYSDFVEIVASGDCSCCGGTGGLNWINDAFWIYLDPNGVEFDPP